MYKINKLAVPVLFSGFLAVPAVAARPVPCASWRPQRVQAAFPGDRVDVVKTWHFDNQPCGARPDGTEGGGGYAHPETGRPQAGTHVYVTNIDAVSQPNALLFDYDDNPEEKADMNHGYFYFHLPPTVTNGWSFLSFDFKLEKGTLDMELRGVCAGFNDAKPTDKFNALGIGFYMSAGDTFSMRANSGGGGGAAGLLQRYRWHRLNLWLPTRHGCAEGIQEGGWLRLDEIKPDGSVVKGAPSRFGANLLFMMGPWTCFDITGRGKTRYLFDNIVYGRVE